MTPGTLLFTCSSIQGSDTPYSSASRPRASLLPRQPTQQMEQDERHQTAAREPYHHHGTRDGGADDEAVAAAEHKRHDYLVGVGLLLLVVLLWTASNFLTNNILTSGWDKPFAVTYANTASFAVYLVPFALVGRRGKRGLARSPQSGRPQKGFWERLGFSLPAASQTRSRRGSYSPIPTSGTPSYDATRLRPVSPVDTLRSSRPRLVHGGRPSSIDGRRPISFLEAPLPELEGQHHSPSLPPAALPPLTLRETAVLAGQFTLVWFAANWSLNAGLGMTSVASGTTLSSASGFFTLGLGSLTGVERFSRTKLLAVVISFMGVVLVTHADAQPDVSGSTTAPSNAPLGDFLALLSAFCYAIYVTLLKLKIKSEERVSMPLFFGFVGIFNILGMWPIGVLLHLTGVETFQFPQDGKTWAGVGVNMCITFVSDFAYLLSMLKTAPLVATVGLSLTIPLAVFIDLLCGTHSGGAMANLGSLAVLMSFVTIGWDDNKAVEEDAAAASAAEGSGFARTGSGAGGTAAPPSFLEEDGYNSDYERGRARASALLGRSSSMAVFDSSASDLGADPGAEREGEWGEQQARSGTRSAVASEIGSYSGRPVSPTGGR